VSAVNLDDRFNCLSKTTNSDKPLNDPRAYFLSALIRDDRFSCSLDRSGNLELSPKNRRNVFHCLFSDSLCSYQSFYRPSKSPSSQETSDHLLRDFLSFQLLDSLFASFLAHLVCLAGELRNLAVC
jgi:hypothetical protein